MVAFVTSMFVVCSIVWSLLLKRKYFGCKEILIGVVERMNLTSARLKFSFKEFLGLNP